ncbi:MAG TPA: gluconate 2-dehydrogenase subunit 3 family protein [Pyrinomonadaceae bacterium]|nr:gluconate 2-dehydrogenase subunit 3 family protein [Pyrinomonadaceae bacterium]
MNPETLRAVVDCLIPPDDFPGAYDAGVCNYLKRLFRTDLASQSGFFRAGIEGIEAEALALCNTAFADLAPEQKISILAAIEAGDVKTTWSIPPSRFFNMLVNTTAEGFYSDPQQGGNRNAVSWVMTGFEDVSDS